MAVAPEALERIYAAKARQRQLRGRLPFHEKIRILVLLQKRADALIRSRGGRGRRIWNVLSQS